MGPRPSALNRREKGKATQGRATHFRLPERQVTIWPTPPASSFVIDSDFVIVVSSFRRGSKEKATPWRRVICGQKLPKIVLREL
jgi:hypothetical protein